MTQDEIDTLHASGIQFPLDSDEIDAALSHANLDPQTCSYTEAFTACQEFANAAQAFGRYPTRGGKRAGSGAPLGNSNRKKTVVRNISVTIRFSEREYRSLSDAAGSDNLSGWIRDAVLAVSKLSQAVRLPDDDEQP